MPDYDISLKVPEWSADDPLDAILTFLHAEGGPEWDQLTWTVTSAADGMTFEVEDLWGTPKVRPTHSQR
jgi:hypothetical protein